MAVGAKRWPPVWLQRHTRRVGHPHGELRVQQGAEAPAARIAATVAAHEDVDRGDADRAREVEVVGRRVLEEPGQERWHLVAGHQVVDAGESVGAEAPVVHDPGEPLVRAGLRHHGHERGAGISGGLGQRLDLGHVRGPRQGPLDEQEGVERAGAADRIHALRRRPGRAPVLEGHGARVRSPP